MLRRGFSNLGVAASALCAVHCAALPVLAGLSAIAEPLHSPVVEATLVGVAALVGFATLVPSYLQHRRPQPLVLLVLGLLLMLGAHQGLPELPAMLSGAVLLFTAQLLNRRCPAPCCNH